jgi:uncharacterized protein HemY
MVPKIFLVVVVIVIVVVVVVVVETFMLSMCGTAAWGFLRECRSRARARAGSSHAIAPAHYPDRGGDVKARVS